METLHVACAVEGPYDAHSAAMVHSVLTCAQPLDVHVHLLHGPGFPAASARRLEQLVRGHGARLSAHAVAPERVAGLPVVAEFTVAMWYRILLPELVAADRVLYLDVDTLALDALAPLWATDLGDAYLGAVTNVLMPHHAGRPASLGLDPAAYFNSGVLLLNLAAMRRDGSTAALRDCAVRRGAELEWPDQDALNLVLGARRVALHPRWNAMNSLRFAWAADVLGAREVAQARTRPGIRHFEGPGENKPWHPACTADDRERYHEHLRATPWRPTRRARAAGAARALVRRGARR